MKSAICFILTLIISISGYSQGCKTSCCNSNSSGNFATFATAEEFKKMHDAPLPYRYDGKGEMVSFKTSDGKNGSAFLIKAEKPTNQYLIIFHEWWGLNDYILQEAAMLQKELGNINVLAIDLYDGKVAATADEASKLVQSLKDERAISLIQGAIAYVGPKAKIATIGWCMGGSWSMQAAIEAGGQCNACVIYYGMPEEKPERLNKIKAPILGIFARKDQWISPDIVTKFVQNAEKASLMLTVKSYSADHAFANPSNPHHDKEASALAQVETLKFLKQNLK